MTKTTVFLSPVIINWRAMVNFNVVVVSLRCRAYCFLLHDVHEGSKRESSFIHHDTTVDDVKRPRLNKKIQFHGFPSAEDISFPFCGFYRTAFLLFPSGQVLSSSVLLREEERSLIQQLMSCWDTRLLRINCCIYLTSFTLNNLASRI